MKIYFCLALLIILSSCNSNRQVHNQTYKDNSFTDLFRTEKGWIAGDGAYSIALKNGTTLWAFGDSYMDCYDTATGTVPCLFQARNALVTINRDNASVMVTMRNEENTPTYFNYGRSRKYWFWPGAGFESHDTAYLFLTRLRSTSDTGMWSFEVVDSNYVAKIASGNKVTYSLLHSGNGITFGVATLIHNGYTYVYGIRSNGFGNDLFAARFSEGDIYSEWEYYDGAAWSSNPGKAQKIHSEFTSSFNLCKIGDKFVLLTTEFSVDCDQGKNIFVSVGENPWGPFTNQHSVWQVDDTLKGHLPFFYCANAHPEFDNGKDELLVTYCINGYGKCVETCTDNKLDPDVYRPKAIRIPYSVLFRKSDTH